MDYSKQIFFLAIMLIGSSLAYAIPQELLQCQEDHECAAIEGVCSSWQVVNRKYEQDVQKQFQSERMSTECVQAMLSPKPTTHCRENLCVITSDPAPSASKKACAVFPRVPNVTDPSLNEVIEKLKWPIAYSQKQALEKLTLFGPQAEVTCPLLEFLWKRSISEPYDSSGECSLGYADFRFEILKALQSIGKGIQTPNYVVEFYKDKEKLRNHSKMEEAVLLYFLSMEQAAEPVGMTILDDLRESRSGEGYRKLQIGILKNLKSIKNDFVPVLQKIAADPQDMENALALKTLQELGATEETSDLTIKVLENPNENQETTAVVIQKLPSNCPDTDRCVELLANLTKGGSFSLMMESLGALGRFGKEALPAVPQILKQYYNPSVDSRASSQKALLSIDPTGEEIISYLTPDLEDPFKVRMAIELLEKFNSEQAKELALKTKERWKF